MLAKTYNINYNLTQRDAVIYIKGSADYNEGGSPYELERAAEYIADGIDFYSKEQAIYSPSVLTRLITNGHPVVIAGYYYNGNVRGTGHAIVAYGFYYSPYTDELMVRVKDPGTERGSAVTYSYNELIKFANRKWKDVIVRNTTKANDTISSPY